MSATEILSAPAPSKVSRYRSLRGKSVSEARSNVDDVLMKQEEQAGIASGLFKSAPSRYRKRAKTIGDKQQNSDDIHQIHATAIPPLPQSPPIRSRTISPLPVAVLQDGKYVVQMRNSNGDAADPDDQRDVDAAHRPPLQGSEYEVAAARAVGPAFPTDATGSNTPPNKATTRWQQPGNPASLGLAITSPTISAPATRNVFPVDIAVTDAEGIGGQHSVGCESPIDPALEQRRRELETEANEAKKWADEVARLEAETDRILEEQRKKDIERAQKQQHQHQQLRSVSSSSSLIGSAKAKSPVLEKFAFLRRGRRSNAATLSPTSSMYSSVEFGRAASLEPNLLPHSFIEAGGRGLVPLHDVPISASNGSERRVTVRCRGMTMNLAVNLDTSTIDILLAASTEMTHPINVATSMMIETYNTLNLERRLRRYERIRDILNSWDRDTQNSLIILPDTFESDQDLELASVPRAQTPPEGFVLQLYHSQRPGKWNKRYITLLQTGQIVASKKADVSNPADKDVQALCHLSDFEIYTPTEAQMRKQLKPPKKFCYAIKSQQKTTVFLETEKFVHFFCTEDHNLAHKFHSHVHAWRSWYLADRLVQMQKRKEEDKPPQIAPVKHKPRKSVGHVKVNGHKLRVSVDETPYSIGQFQPLLDLKRFERPLDEFGSDWELDNSRRSMVPPLPTDAIKSRKEGRRANANSNANQAAYATNGLLGDVYDERKKAAQKHEQAKAQDGKVVDGPFTEGPNLLNGGVAPNTVAAQTSSKEGHAEAISGSDATQLAPDAATAPVPTPPSVPVEPPKPEASSWFPSAAEHSARSRSVSARQAASRPSTSAGPASGHDRDQHQQQRQQKRQPAPLVDLTPKYKEAPQWNHSGKGRGVIVPEGMLLVDMISTGHPTSPGLSNQHRFLEIPPRNLVRRDTGDVPQRPSTSDGRPSVSRARSTTAHSSNSNITNSSSGRRGASTGADAHPSSRSARGAPPVPPLPPNSSRTVNAFPIPPRPSTSGSVSMRPSMPRSTSGTVRREAPQPQQHQQQYSEERGRDPRPRDQRSGRSQRSGSVRVV